MRHTTKLLFERPLVDPNSLPDADIDFQRVQISGSHDTESDEAVQVGTKLKRAMALRDKYLDPMPAENWGGLDRGLYTEFMASQVTSSLRHGSQVQQPPGAVFGPPSTLSSSLLASSSLSSSSSHGAAAAAAGTAEKTQHGRAKLTTGLGLLSQASTCSSVRRGASAAAQDSTQRLRRRMDVPYDPYSRDLSDVPPPQTEVGFVTEDGVIYAMLSEPIAAPPHGRHPAASPASPPGSSSLASSAASAPASPLRPSHT